MPNKTVLHFSQLGKALAFLANVFISWGVRKNIKVKRNNISKISTSTYELEPIGVLSAKGVGQDQSQ
jgi:hypothetical protein